MPGAQEMIDVGECGLAQCPHRLMRDDQHLLAHDRFDPHALRGDLAVCRGVLAQGEERRVTVRRKGVGRQGRVHVKSMRFWCVRRLSFIGHTFHSPTSKAAAFELSQFRYLSANDMLCFGRSSCCGPTRARLSMTRKKAIFLVPAI